MPRILLALALLVLGCSREDKLATARKQANEARAHAEAAQAEAAEAQQKLAAARAEQKAAEDEKASLEKQLAQAKQEEQNLIDQANTKLVALKKQRETMPDGPKRKELDAQIEQLTKLVNDSQAQPSSSP